MLRNVYLLPHSANDESANDGKEERIGKKRGIERNLFLVHAAEEKHQSANQTPHAEKERAAGCVGGY